MEVSTKTPITLITGFLGSGKTTLLRHILGSVEKKIAILMNEFGEIDIDSRVVEGKNVRMAELEGGCVCCSLLGEFEAAVQEVIETVDPDLIVVETTGVAEPEALTFDIQESLPQARLDGVITLVDAAAMLKYPDLGHTTEMQIKEADLLLLNKTDLVAALDLGEIERKLRDLNQQALIVHCERARVDSGLLFGISRDRPADPPEHVHQTEFSSFHYRSDSLFDQGCFEQFLGTLSEKVCRAKGFIRFTEGSCLFNFVSGRWEFEELAEDQTVLVFIGKDLEVEKDHIVEALRRCEL